MWKNKRKETVIIKTKQEIDNIRESGKYLTEILNILYNEANIGVSLLDLEVIAENFMIKNKVKWAFKWYHGFPANLCLSVNDCLVHGIPDDYILKNGDVLKIDCGVTYRAGISDSAVCVVIGWELANPLWFDLMKTTKKALDASLQYIQPYKKLYDYSSSVFQYIKDWGFDVIRNLTGHGVWNMVHEPPHIYNYPCTEMRRETLKPGMVIALEPITAISSIESISKPWNDRNLYTKKWDIGAQREYTLLVTENGYEILSGVREDIYLT